VVDLLAISTGAAEAIKGLVARPEVPEGAGLKLSPQESQEGTAIELNLVTAPADSDQIVREGDAQVFVAEELVPALDDKLLDAGVEEDQVRFTLSEQPPEDEGPLI
jgi:iron-sulfur cluster assembly protein